MGKDLKGKELGIGICQRKDGLYTARFDYWIERALSENIKGDSIRPNTIRNYKERFEHNIKKCIGSMLLSEVKPMHCQNVLNQMKNGYKTSAIYQTRITLCCMFSDAAENDVILKNPVTKSVKYNIGKEPKKARAFTIDEQKKFLETAKKSSNYNQFAFILQTGLRTGELIGLKWSAIDWEKRAVHIQRTMEYRYSVGEW